LDTLLDKVAFIGNNGFLLSACSDKEAELEQTVKTHLKALEPKVGKIKFEDWYYCSPAQNP